MADSPQTRASIAADLLALGLRPGDTALVHSSLRSLGWVCGGAVAVVQALLDVLGTRGTIVVPTQTMENSDPSLWSRPPVPEEWWPVIRDNMPGFDPRVAPSRGIGAVAEVVRTWPAAVRSNHPQASFAALGANAVPLTAVHRLDCQLGEESPLGAIERAGGKVLLLGVGFDACTAFHLAEYRAGCPTTEYGAAVLTETGREWVTFTDVATNSDDFAALGAAFEQTGDVSRGRVGTADSRLFAADAAVTFATDWIRANRGERDRTRRSAG